VEPFAEHVENGDNLAAFVGFLRRSVVILKSLLVLEFKRDGACLFCHNLSRRFLQLEGQFEFLGRGRRFSRSRGRRCLDE